MDTEPKPWTRLPGEPGRWHGVFSDFYLTKGPSRTLEDTWRRSQEAASGSARQRSRRPSGSFYRAAKQWRWFERAEAYDAEARAQALRERDAAVERMNKDHQAMTAIVFSAVARSFNKDKFQGMSALPWLRALKEAIGMQRQALGLPVTIEEVRARTPAEVAAEATGVAIAGADIQRFELNPDLLAAGLMILQTHESIPEPVADKKPSEGVQTIEPDAACTDLPPAAPASDESRNDDST